MNILDLVNKQRIYFDGGMGTLLQVNGLKPGEEQQLPQHHRRGHLPVRRV